MRHFGRCITFDKSNVNKNSGADTDGQRTDTDGEDGTASANDNTNNSIDRLELQLIEAEQRLVTSGREDLADLQGKSKFYIFEKFEIYCES